MKLQDRLREATHWDAEYAGSLSNHLPMALTALHRLGASEARLADYSARYTPRLHPAPAIQPWPAGEPWRERFGDAWAWPVYRDFFRQWLGHEGMAAVLQQALPYLLPGCGAAAFHGMIRVAYAVEALAPEELADGLAYWACRWLDAGPGAGARVAAGPDPAGTGAAPGSAGIAAGRPPELAVLIAELAALPVNPAGLIVHRMLDAVRAPAFQGMVARLQPHAATLPRLARLAAQRYARSGNFTVLHLVTSAHALRVLLPFVDDADAAVAAYWRAYAAGVVAARDLPGRAATLLDWPVLVQAALASEDDHLVKLVDACRQEQAAHGGAPDWQRAASRAVHDAAGRGGATRAAGAPAC